MLKTLMLNFSDFCFWLNIKLKKKKGSSKTTPLQTSKWPEMRIIVYWGDWSFKMIKVMLSVLKTDNKIFIIFVAGTNIEC